MSEQSNNAKQARKPREQKAAFQFATAAQGLASKSAMREHLNLKMLEEKPESRAQFIAMSLRQYLGARLDGYGNYVQYLMGISKPHLLIKAEDIATAHEIWLEVREEILQGYTLHEKPQLAQAAKMAAVQAELPFGEAQPLKNTTTVGQENKLDAPVKRGRKPRVQAEKVADTTDE